MLALRPSYAGEHLRWHPSYASASGITVVTDVDTGNIDATSVVITDGETSTPFIELAVRNTSKLVGWTHIAFAVENAEGKTPTFRLSRANNGMGHLATSWLPAWTQDGITWTLAASRTYVTSPSPGYVEWELGPLPAGRVHIASGPVSRQSDTEDFAAYLLANYASVVAPTASADSSGVYNTSPAETDDTGRDVGEHPMFAFKLSWAGPTTDGARKRKIVLLGGTHGAGEGTSFWQMRAFLLAALDDTSAEAIAFRANWDVYAYWNLVPSALYGGSARYTFRSGVNPNRAWDQVTHALQEVNVTRTAILADTGGSADIMFSWHGTPLYTSPFTAWTAEPNYTPGTRDPRYDAVFGGAGTKYGSAPGIQLSTNTGTTSEWAKNELSAQVAFTIEYGSPGTTSPTTHEAAGSAWLWGVAYADSLGLFVEPDDGAISGASVAAVTATGSLSTAISLAGSAASLALADGTLTAQIRLQSSALASAMAAAGLTTAIQLAAEAQAGASASGALTTHPAGLEGHATASALAAGALTVRVLFAGNAVADALATGELHVPGEAAALEADATALAIAAGGLTTAIQLQGAAASVVQATGALEIALTLRADALVQAMASGVLSTQIRMNAAAVASAIVQASLTTAGAPLAEHGVRRPTHRGYQRITARRPKQYA